MANVEGQADPLLFVIYHFPFAIFEMADYAETPPHRTTRIEAANWFLSRNSGPLLG